MRLLADENIPGVVVRAHCEADHDVAWMAEIAPSTPDGAVLGLASREDWLGHFAVVDDRFLRLRALPER